MVITVARQNNFKYEPELDRWVISLERVAAYMLLRQLQPWSHPAKNRTPSLLQKSTSSVP